MARNRSEEDRVKTWADRISSSEKLYKKWSDEMDTKHLEDYYKGKQWKGLSEEDAQKRYVINLIYSTIEVNKPSMVFHRPQIRIQPRPSRLRTFGSQVDERARLIQDTIQTFIDDPDVNFELETSLALHEAHFRFGVIEVGYSADYVDNPNAGKPVLKEDKETPVRDSNGKEVLEPDRIAEREDLYVRRIPASQFRVSLSSTQALNRNDWVAYYEWHYLEDLKRNPLYDTAGLKSTGTIQSELREKVVDADELERYHGMVKVWKVWDVRLGVRHVIAEGHKKFLMEDEPFKFLPFAVMKFHEMLDSFYPLPPVYNWMDPQNEINETREMQRAHRRRFYRRYTMMNDAVDEPELQKMETGGDGVVIRANQPNPLIPIPDAPLSGDVWTHLAEAKVDFLAVSGIGGDQRGVAESETATQANIIDARSRLRETSARSKVGDWLADVARLMMLTLREYMTLPFWVKRNVDPFAIQQAQQAAMDPNAQQDPMAAMTAMAPMVKVTQEWAHITAEEIGDMDFDVFVELSTMSPVTVEAERMNWNQVLAMLVNPQMVMLMALSEPLLRKTLKLYNIQSENEIKEVQRVCRTMVMLMQQQAAQEQQAQKEQDAAKAGVNPQLIEQSRANAQRPNQPPGGGEQIGNRMRQITQGPQGRFN